MLHVPHQTGHGAVPGFMVEFTSDELCVAFDDLTPETASSMTADASDTGKNPKAQKSQPLGYGRKEQTATFDV